MKHLTSRLALLAASVGFTASAHAIIPVIDLQSLIQLQQQVMYWQQQLSAMATEVTTTQQQLAASTGTRGMGALLSLSAAQRNYLPPSAAAIEAAAQTASGTLGGAYRDSVGAQSALPAGLLASLSPVERALITGRREAVATRSSVMQTALSNASQRFLQLQGLLDAIDLTNDQKGALDLQARIAGEQVMTANENAKLAAASGWTDANVLAGQTLSREAALAAHGSFAQRFHPTVR